MRVQQVSIFLENSAGRLAEVTKILKDAQINLRAIMIADTADFGILRVISEDSQKMLDVLHAHQYTTRISEVIAVQVENRPGSLNDILVLFHSRNLNIEYLYTAFENVDGRSIIILKCEDVEAASRLVQENGLSCIGSI